MSVKAVVFDYGRVISFSPADGVMDELAALASVRRGDLEALIWNVRDDYDRGLLSGPEYYRKIMDQLGAPPDGERDKKMAEIDMRGWERINPGTVKLMEEIKAAGFLLGILSNMPFDFLEYGRKNLPVFGLPHRAVYSCEAGVIKPEAAIYRKLISVMECPAAEIVFFDDVKENVDKALEPGIHAFLWESPETARRQLAGLGVTL